MHMQRVILNIGTYVPEGQNLASNQLFHLILQRKATFQVVSMRSLVENAVSIRIIPRWVRFWKMGYMPRNTRPF